MSIYLPIYLVVYYTLKKIRKLLTGNSYDYRVQRQPRRKLQSRPVVSRHPDSQQERRMVAVYMLCCTDSCKSRAPLVPLLVSDLTAVYVDCSQVFFC